MKTLRRQLFININQQIERQKKVHPNLLTIIDYLREQAYNQTNNQNINIWTGLWSKQQINDIQAKLEKFKFTNKYTINTIYKLSRIYTDAITQLYRCRGILKLKKDQLIHPVDINYQVATSIEQITEYFENDNLTPKNKKCQKQTKPSKVTDNYNTKSPTTPTQTLMTTTTEIEAMTTIENVIKDTITENNYSQIPKYYSLYVNSIYKKRTMQRNNKTTNHIDNQTAKKPRQQSITQITIPTTTSDRYTKTKRRHIPQSNSTSITDNITNGNTQQENIASNINILIAENPSKRQRKQLTVKHNHNTNNDIQGCSNTLNYLRNISPLQNTPNKEPQAEPCISQERVGIG